jgi:hypothetical protein
MLVDKYGGTFIPYDCMDGLIPIAIYYYNVLYLGTQESTIVWKRKAHVYLDSDTRNSEIEFYYNMVEYLQSRPRQ